MKPSSGFHPVTWERVIGPLPIPDPHATKVPSNTLEDIRLAHMLEMAFVIWSLVLAWLN
jgi:hypothetical protein